MRAPLIVSILFMFAALSASAKEVNLKWKAIEGAKKYNLEVARDADFKDRVLVKTLTKNSLPSDLHSGIYYLRVQGVDKEGVAGIWSAPFKLVVTAPVDAVDNVAQPKKVVFVRNAPDVGTAWKTTDAATSFKVKVIKDGKEVFTKETSTPNVDFKPTESGDYKVEVSPGYKEYFGAPVTVSSVHVEKKVLESPKWHVAENKRLNSRRHLDLKWMPVGDAASYRVKVYKIDENGGAKTDKSRSPASEAQPVFVTDKLRDSQLLLEPLPPGRYYASVEAVSVDQATAPSTKYEFEVKRAKPVEFENYDVSFSYSVNNFDYESSVYEAGANSNFKTVGGSAQIDGSLWWPESNWGLKARGTWGGASVQGTNYTYNDLLAAAQYRWAPFPSGLHTDIKPFIGARAWTLPILIPQNNGSGGGSNGNTQSFSSTLAGPAAGFEIIRPFTEKFAMYGGFQVAFPLTNSVFGGGVLNQIHADPSSPSARIGIGAKYALPGSLRLLAMAGFNDDQMQFNAVASPGTSGPPSGPAPSGVRDRIEMGSSYVMLGIETSDEGSSFRNGETDSPRPERFSDFTLTAGYSYLPVNYNATIIENGSGNGGSSAPFNFNASSGGAVQLDGNAWFRESHHGVRVEGDWSGFTYQDANISNPEFKVQWNFRPQTKPEPRNWNWTNAFGIRAWRVPIIDYQSGGSFFAAQSPQLLGPAETFALTKGFSSNWVGRFLAEIAAPLFLTDRQSNIDHVRPDPSYSAELAAIRSFGPDFTAGLGLGYRFEELSYVPTVTQSSGGTGFSSVQMGAPTISIFTTYSF